MFPRQNAATRTMALGLGMILLTTAFACRKEPRSGVPRSTITISILQQGSPLKVGTIDIVNKASGEGASEPLDEFGMATLTGVAHGEYAVAIQPPPSLAADGSQIHNSVKFSVDPKYSSSEKTPLSIIVDDKTKSFELTVE